MPSVKEPTALKTVAKTLRITKQLNPWKEPRVVATFEDGWKIIFVKSQEDLTHLGQQMGHCSGTHAYWAKAGVFYFWVLVDPQGNPHATIHGKDAKMMGCEPSAYDGGATIPEYGVTVENKDFGRDYRCPLPPKPNDISDDIWQKFVKAHKAISDNYKKNTGTARIAGRKVPFDGKQVIILSCSTRYQDINNGNQTKYRRRVNEWLIAQTKGK